MGKTIVAKILDNRVGSGTAMVGEEIGLIIDQCLTQDSTGTMAWLEFDALGIDRVKAKKVVSYNDHTSLSFRGESTDDHFFLQSSASRYGAIYSKAGNNGCHQVHYERFGVPGQTLLGSDSHTPTCGGLGMMAAGVGGMDVAVAMGGGLFYMTIPKVMKIELHGKLRVDHHRPRLQPIPRSKVASSSRLMRFLLDSHLGGLHRRFSTLEISKEARPRVRHTTTLPYSCRRSSEEILSCRHFSKWWQQPLPMPSARDE